MLWNIKISKSSRMGPLRAALIVVVLIAAGFCVYKIASIQKTYDQADEVYSALEEYKPNIQSSQNGQAQNETDPYTPQHSEWLKMYIMENEIAETVDPRLIQIRALVDKYPDAVGWLFIPGTTIDYPIVQGKDNFYYLRRDINKNYLYSGTPYLDFRCQKDLSNTNSVIYGHHMNNGTVFNDLDYFKKQEFMTENPDLYLALPDRIIKARIFAALIVNPYDNEFLYDNEPSADYLSSIKKKAQQYDDTYQHVAGEKYITLSTCNYDFDNARLVVIAAYKEVAADNSEKPSAPIIPESEDK